MDQRSVKINNDMLAVISAANTESKLDQPLYAINWFNYKSAWLYKMYSLLVLSDVRSVGGKPIIKAEVLEKWEGEDRLDREVLLVVKYPGAGQFLKMIGKKSFQLKSLFRINAVKKFVFGFTRKITDDRLTIEAAKNDYYLLHLFSSSNSQTPAPPPLEKLAEQGISTFFYGATTAYLGRKQIDEDLEKIRFDIEGVLILHAKSLDPLKHLGDHSDFQSFKKQYKTNNLYLLKRLF